MCKLWQWVAALTHCQWSWPVHTWDAQSEFSSATVFKDTWIEKCLITKESLASHT